MDDEPKIVKSVASVKAPTDPAKLAKVQINNQKPPKKTKQLKNKSFV